MKIYKVSVYKSSTKIGNYDYANYDLDTVFCVRTDITFTEFKETLEKESGSDFDLNESSFDWLFKDYTYGNYHIDSLCKITIEELNLY